jgi:hypothetical protein
MAPAGSALTEWRPLVAPPMAAPVSGHELLAAAKHYGTVFSEMVLEYC